MKKNILKKSSLGKYVRKHYYISYFGFLEGLMLLAFIVEFILFVAFGYSTETEYSPLANHRLSLPFWQKCGTYGIYRVLIPFPNLFCINDTHTYLNPFLRAVLFGIEMYSVTMGLILGVILLTIGISVIKRRKEKNIGIDSSAWQRITQMVLQLIYLIVILVVIYHFA